MRHRPQSRFGLRALGALLLFFSLGCRPALAGWYEVANYVGQIGDEPIHLSLQKYEHFGSGLNIRGSYYLDRQMAPVALYGQLGAAGGLALCEISTEEEFERVILRGSATPVDTSHCPIQMNLREGFAKGSWLRDGQRQAAALREIGRLDNTGTLTITKGFEVPFWGQTAGHVFFGAYQQQGATAQVSIKVVNKHSGSVVQRLRPEHHGCSFGFFMTPIYMNLAHDGRDGTEEIALACAGPKGGKLARFRLNKSSGKFDLVSPR